MLIDRKNVIINILHQIDFRVESIGVNEILKLVTSFKKDNGLSWNHLNPIVRDGFLIINDQLVGRVASKLPKIAYNEYEYNIEGKCIAD